MPQENVLTVSEITRTIKLLLEENIPTIWVIGEISNFKPHYSGHYYFTLKDENAQISAVLWKTRAAFLPFQLEDGMLVQALGNVRVYEKSGRYQLDVIRIQQAGVGQLQLEFERLKQKLLNEGLFDPAHKQVLPSFPQRIGVVTSPTGAAIQDIINILRRRAPHVEIIIRPTKVQGEGAAQDIVRAISEFNQFKAVDLLIVGRGGGSLEDLWAFNEEIVARTIYNSQIPVISAVGHEVDFTIADFVADLRAPTPSAAAELAVPDFSEVREQIISANRRMIQTLFQTIQRFREKITAIQKSYGLRRPEDLLKQYAFRVDELSNQLQRNFQNLLANSKQHVNQIGLRLDNLNPKQVLKRGFSISFIDGKVISDSREVQPAAVMTTELYKGKILSSVTDCIEEN